MQLKETQHHPPQLKSWKPLLPLLPAPCIPQAPPFPSLPHNSSNSSQGLKPSPNPPNYGFKGSLHSVFPYQPLLRFSNPPAKST